MPAPLLLHHLGNCWSNKYPSKIFHNMSHSITMANIPRKECKYCKMLHFLLSFCPLLINQNKTESPPAHLSQISTRTFYFVENSEFCCRFQIISSSDGAPSLMRDQICPPPEFGYSQTRKSFENPSLKRLTLKSLSRWKTCNVNFQCTLKKILKYWRYWDRCIPSAEDDITPFLSRSFNLLVRAGSN